MKDIINTSSRVQQSADYDIFKTLPGNRPVDGQHVTQLIRHMTEHGNLIAEFPITVNERMEVIDGQHRLAALKELGWVVAYVVHPGLTVETVRNINSAQRNWRWQDYMDSYTALGNDNYRRLSQLVEQFPGFGFRTIMTYLGLSNLRRGNTSYTDGEMIITPENYTHAVEQLTKVRELFETIEGNNRVFALAIYSLSRNPDYDHARMLHKLQQYGGRIKSYSLIGDYMRALEDLYNFNVKDPTNIVRLF